jgi:uncharacterized protein (TIGR02145 family)
MQENLRYGTVTLPYGDPQKDNCLFEKNCLTGDPGCAAYGGYYAWDEVMQYEIADKAQGFCPPGWHIPNEAEWDILADFVSTNSGPGIAGSFLKDQGSATTFMAEPNGIFYLNSLESFTTGSVKGTFFWTSTYNNVSKTTVAKGINVNTPSVSRYESSRANAFPVRCVKD